MIVPTLMSALPLLPKSNTGTKALCDREVLEVSERFRD
jgi:hypothetical protein